MATSRSFLAVSRTIIIDVLLVFTVTMITGVAFVALVLPVPRYVFVAAVAGLTLIAIGTVLARFMTRPDKLRAQQSHQILEIANASLAHLRRGLDQETAQAVCRLALEETEAAAVAITDRSEILGFAGIGEDHHTTGGPILTRATRDTLETGEHSVLETREEIGCSQRGCLLQAAIVMPLVIRDEPAGTLKFYYTTPRLLNETQVTMVEGLAKLLSTQLELAELERQTELACRMELKALQAQINPHFLFNTINTIASLTRTDPVEARLLLREFASFYRRVLEHGDDLITLGQEVEQTETYLRLEKARFGDRIEVIVDVPEDTREVLVPAFVVQPLVENAVQHAMRADAVLHVRVASRFEDGKLCVEVRDDGVGIAEADVPRLLETGYGTGLGIALKNVDDRLHGHFGPGSGLRVSSTLGKGTSVTLDIVLRRPEREAS